MVTFTPLKVCTYCSLPAKSKCSKCSTVYFCGPEHQRLVSAPLNLPSPKLILFLPGSCGLIINTYVRAMDWTLNNHRCSNGSQICSQAPVESGIFPSIVRFLALYSRLDTNEKSFLWFRGWRISARIDTGLSWDASNNRPLQEVDPLQQTLDARSWCLACPSETIFPRGARIFQDLRLIGSHL